MKETRVKKPKVMRTTVGSIEERDKRFSDIQARSPVRFASALTGCISVTQFSLNRKWQREKSLNLIKFSLVSALANELVSDLSCSVVNLLLISYF